MSREATFASLDVISSDAFAEGYPHEQWERLRREAPICRLELADFDPFWAVTRHDDVVRISHDSALFLNAPRLMMLPNSARAPERERSDPARKSRLRTLLHMDNPEHRRYRQLAVRWFTPHSIRSHESAIQETVRHLLDELGVGHGSVELDFVTSVAGPLSIKVIARLLGVPKRDEALVLHLSNQGIGAEDPEYRAAGESSREARRKATRELFAYLTQMVTDRRARPRSDLASHLCNAELDGAPLPMLELLSYLGIVAVAGHETTKNAVVGGVAAFSSRPAEWTRLRRDPSLLRSAVEEIVRFSSPVIHFTRTPTRDVEIRGHRIRAGDPVTLFYPSANRDETVFEGPDQFRIDRAPNPHVAFGAGEHFCLGAHLARLELQVLFSELSARVGAIELTGPPAHLRSSFVGGFKRFPVRLEPAVARRSVRP
ncbi:MAG TPA: cytochrome P450 [Myxococcota bacterium]|nr:cytochrome P450 [Myxococcota bacterium]